MQSGPTSCAGSSKIPRLQPERASSRDSRVPEFVCRLSLGPRRLTPLQESLRQSGLFWRKLPEGASHVWLELANPIAHITGLANLGQRGTVVFEQPTPEHLP